MSFLSNKYNNFIKEEIKKQKAIIFAERQRKYKEAKKNETIDKSGTRNIDK